MPWVKSKPGLHFWTRSRFIYAVIPAEFKRNIQNADMCLVEANGMDSLYKFTMHLTILQSKDPHP